MTPAIQATSKLPSIGVDTPIYLDADGVFMNFFEAYFKYVSELYGMIAIAPEPSMFNFTDVFPDHDKPYRYIAEFIESNHFANMNPYPQALSAIKAMKSAGYNMTVVTACGDTSKAISGRLNQFERHFQGDFVRTLFVPLGGCKKRILSELPKGIFVDDQFQVCETGVAAGHKTRLFRRRYNENISPELLEKSDISLIGCLSELIAA